MWILAFVLSFAFGCADDRERAGERYVARLPLKSDRDWRLESVVNPQPQKAPWNVQWEVTRFPGAQPTEQQQRMADELYERSRASAHRNGWFDYENGSADGFSLLKGGAGTHYVNYDYVFDDRFLDPDHPEFLMYYEVPGGMQLVGYMYIVPKGQEGPQIAGPLTRWHYHLWATPSCILNGRVSVGRPVNGKCAEGQPSQKSPEMLHVWLVDHPDGRFASKMSLPRSLMQSLGEPGKASN